MATSSQPQTTEMNLAYPYRRLVCGEAIPYQGVLVSINTSDGKAYNAVTTDGYRVIGVSAPGANNTTTQGYADGDTGTFRQGIFSFVNSTTHPVLNTQTGLVCEVEDNATVCATGTSTKTSKPVAGIVQWLDAKTLRVYVDVGRNYAVTATTT